MNQISAFTRLCTLLAAFMLLSNPVHAQVERYLEGVHYTRMPETSYLKMLDIASGKADILEVFWYGCPSCDALDPLLEAWVQRQADSIRFSRSPMIWNETTEHHARVFFAAQQLGIYEKIHSEIFAAIHQQQNYLLDKDSTAALFERHGIAPVSFQSAWRSFAVDASLRKAASVQREMRVPGVPALVVSGRWGSI